MRSSGECSDQTFAKVKTIREFLPYALTCLVLVALVKFVASCSLWPIGLKEIRRVPLEGNRIEAVLVERNAGALSGFSYGVALVERGASAQDEDLLLIADRLLPEHVSMLWHDSRTLRITLPYGCNVFKQIRSTSMSGRTYRLEYSIR